LSGFVGLAATFIGAGQGGGTGIAFHFCQLLLDGFQFCQGFLSAAGGDGKKKRKRKQEGEYFSHGISSDQIKFFSFYEGEIESSIKGLS
jgi:hypothetical protein